MKPGDLVRLRWSTYASNQMNARQKLIAEELGIVLEKSENAVKVIFPTRGNKTYSFLENNLEVVSTQYDSRVKNSDLD